MGSDVTARVIAAIAAVLVAELTAKALDWIGLTEEVARLPREIIKAVAAAIAALLAEGMINDTEMMDMVSQSDGIS
jgi:hypothetical protein